jgi:hypothetical protein
MWFILLTSTFKGKGILRDSLAPDPYQSLMNSGYSAIYLPNLKITQPDFVTYTYMIRITCF